MDPQDGKSLRVCVKWALKIFNASASLSGRPLSTTKALATKSTITNVSGTLTFFRPREMLKKSPLAYSSPSISKQSKDTKGVISRENCSLPPAKRPMIFQPFWTTSNHRVDPYRDEFSTERFVGRYRGISTRTKLEVLPRNLCPLINERRLLLTNPASSTRQTIKSKHPSELAVKDDLSNTSVTLSTLQSFYCLVDQWRLAVAGATGFQNTSQ